MKILLIATNQETSPFPVAPVGALLVASAAERAGHMVTFIDMMFAGNPLKAIKSALKSDNYDVVAFSIRNLDNCLYSDPKSYFDDVKQMVQAVCSFSKAPIVIGGSGFSVAPYSWLKRLDIHYGVVGDGEIVFVKLLQIIDSKRSDINLKGVLTKNSLKPISGLPESFPVAKLDNEYLPFHNKCLYKRYIDRGGFVSVQTKRGCPFKCSYCVYPLLEGEKYRLRSPELIADEIERIIKEQDIRTFYFSDSVFNSPRSHAIDICKSIIKRKLKFQWMAYCNPVGFDLELASKMVESGCAGIEFGLDSATDKILVTMGKPFTTDEIKTSLKAASDAKLPCAVQLLFGSPGENAADILDTQKFLDSCATPNAVLALMGIRIYENTPIARSAIEEGVIDENKELFEPVYYLSQDLGKNPTKTLDEIAWQRNEWSTPTDWAKPSLKRIQEELSLAKKHPQWKDASNYGKYIRR